MPIRSFGAPAAFLLFLGFLIGGCGGSSDALTLEAYFAEFEALDADIDAQIEEAFADFPEGEDALTNEANLPFFKGLVSAFPNIVRDAVDRLNDLDPPSEVEQAHGDLVDAGEALLVAFEDGNDVIQEAETMAQFAVLNEQVEPDIAVAEAAFDSACLAVVDIAEANGITVNVTCEDEM